MATFFRLVFKAFVIAAGLVLAASFAIAFAVLALAWLVRSSWARLSGRPVRPFTARMRRPVMPSRTPRADAVSPRRGMGDIVDVEVKG
jgi:hypothetical protein